MNCQDVQRHCIEQAGSPLEARYEAHLAGCPTCRAVYQRTLAVVGLIGLKRHERPDSFFETRNLAAIRSRIQEESSRGWASRLWAVLEAPAPALRYGLAAAVLAMIGANVMLLQYLPSLNVMSNTPAEAPLVSAEPVQLASTNESPEPFLAKPVFVFEYPSNRQPSPVVNMGPGAVPVSFQVP